MNITSAGIGSLGCIAITPEQIFQTAMNAGFPADTATKMVAIALKESSGCTDATNIRAAGTNGPTDPGEESYGLWQINVGPNGNYTLPGRLGIQKTQLLDPDTNARAAFLLWNGNDANLDTAWYIVRDPTNKARYESFLPTAQQAAANVLGSNGNQTVYTSAPEILPDGQTWAGLGISGVSGGLLVAGIAGILLIDLLRR